MKTKLFLTTLLLGLTLTIAHARNTPRPGESGRFTPYDNMALLYGGNMGRANALWTEERLRPHVSYVDNEGKEHWLFDAFLALEIYDKSTPAEEGAAMGIGYGNHPADKGNWQHFIDYWFTEGIGFDALDKVVGETKGRIGKPSTKRKIVVSIPDPIPYYDFRDTTSKTIYWGEINGRQMDFARGEDRLAACKWFVDTVIKRWKKAKFKNLELEGFYCFSEELVTKDNGYNPAIKRWEEVYPALSDYVHSKKMSMSWIPYNWATGSDRWEKFHFDFVMIQPNYLWHPEYNMEEWKDRLKRYNLSMELEIDDKVLYGAPNWESFRERFYYYFQMCKDLGLYGNSVLSHYMGEDTLHKLSVSQNEADRQLYKDFCEFVLGNIQH